MEINPRGATFAPNMATTSIFAYTWKNRRWPMGKHRLEIELTDDLLSRIDSVSARTNHSRMDVVVETLREHLPEDRDVRNADPEILTALRALDDAYEEGMRLSINRSDRDILESIRAFRGED
jgi:hypothetical protein